MRLVNLRENGYFKKQVSGNGIYYAEVCKPFGFPRE